MQIQDCRGHKRPLPPPQSRQSVIEAAKVASSYIDLDDYDDDSENQRPPSKRCRVTDDVADRLPFSPVVQTRRTDSSSMLQGVGLSSCPTAAAFGTTVATNMTPLDFNQPTKLENDHYTFPSISSAMLAAYPSPESSSTPWTDESDNSLLRLMSFPNNNDEDEDFSMRREQMIAGLNETRRSSPVASEEDVFDDISRNHPFLADASPKLCTDNANHCPSFGTSHHQEARRASISSAFDTPNINEHLLDFAEQHRTFDHGSKKCMENEGKTHLRQRRHRRDPNEIHPASRQAAEKYRSQSRHIEHGSILPATSNNVHTVEDFQSSKQLAERECRLKALTNPEQHAISRNPSQIAEIWSPDPGLTESPMNGTNNVKPSSLPNLRTDSALNEHKSSPVVSDGYSTRLSRLSAPERLAAGHDKEHSSRNNAQETRTLSKAVPCPYPRQGEVLVLPKNYDIFDEETKSIIRQHMTLKDRQRDLQVIKDAFEMIAHLKSVTRFEKREFQEVNIVTRFAGCVLDQDLSGCKTRKRIQDIKFNFRSRLDRIGYEAPEEQVQETRRRMFARRHLEKLDSELPTLDERIEVLRQLRYTATTMRHSAKKKDTRARVQKVKPTNTDKDQEMGNYRKPLSKSERGRLSYERWENDRIFMLKSKMKAFDDKTKVSVGGEDAHGDVLEHGSGEQNDDKESTISEENEGEEFMRPLNLAALHPAELTIHDVEAGRNEQPQRGIEPGSRGVQTALKNCADVGPLMTEYQRGQIIATQGQSQTLLQEQVRRAAQRELAFKEAGSNGDDADTDDAENQSFDDESDNESEMEFDSGEERQIYAYVVKAVFSGVADYVDGEEYEVGRYMSSQKASKCSTRIMNEVFNIYKRGYDGQEAPTCKRTYELNKDGLEEQKLETGSDGPIEARIWTQKEIQTLDYHMYQRAKFRSACVAKSVFVVEWERTIRPVQPEVEDEQSQHQKDTAAQDNGDTDRTAGLAPASAATAGSHASESGETAGKRRNRQTNHDNDDDNDDNLFSGEPDISPSLSIPSSSNDATTTTKTSSSHSAAQLQLHSCISSANRAAKNLFFTWWQKHLLEAANHAYIRQEDMYMEEALERLGDRGCWKREEDFDYYDEKDGREGCGGDQGSDEASSKDNEHGRRKVLMNDRFKVWVSEVKVKGPGN